ncbi:probable ribose-5-phosphate isomerase 3, chloroplastic [Physcomitrium patens]|uniref:ribose-5-phosphate isomerase n=1 Tax=Physcomitrium patens TaxID=3218 RepID=A0A2K1J7Y1_PHYPA|nr:probable ribose-5-phosphate isomerase 3, chloroplastic [Physcomitrium patens]PNR37645.1 hypothetical protein PHYPA_020754 [Physcomitrium patens]|eukprot:XP_024397860.1 probable ribose-5-phosphate isomerase 3, chloroplastic [Physcomitrella patens]
MASTMLESHLVSSVTLRVAAAPRNSAASASASATAQAVPCKALGASSSTLLRGGQLRTGFVAVHRRPCTMAFRPRAQSQGTKLTQDELKKIAAEKAVEYVKSGMVLGLGTGSTAAFAVAKIGELLKEGKLTDIVGVPTSKRTAEQAASLGIPLSVLDDHPKIDLAIDGADEVDPDLNLVKGRGGALLREKMVEAASAKFVVIVDETKLVKGLGGSKLAMPVEVVQFCWKYNAERLKNLPELAGCEVKLRMDGDKPYVTDNSNYIIDLYFEEPIVDANAAAQAISALEGVVDHGLFLNMASAVIIAGSDGVTVQTKDT